MSADDLTVGFDVGTTSVKGGIFDLEGRLLASFRKNYPKTVPKPGWVEQDPEHWVRLIKEGLLTFSGRIDLSRVSAMAICSQVNTHVFVDEHGTPVSPAIVWQDTRASEIARTLDASFSNKEKKNIWGGDFVIDPSFALSRAVWFAEYRPDLWRRTRWILSPKDYCKLSLTGLLSTDPISSVGLTTPEGAYVHGLEACLKDFEQRLPPLHDIFTPQDEVQLSELPGFNPVLVNGTMDAWANLFGSGAITHGDTMLVAGTSSIVGLLSDYAQPTRGIISFAPFRGKYLHAGPTQAGADAFAWFSRVCGRNVESLLAMVQARHQKSAPLLFLPHLHGERAPLWDSTARGVFAGLTQDHDLIDMAHAVLQGVAFSERHLLEEIQKAARCRPATIRLSGGSSRSSAWAQIRSDVLQIPLERVSIADSGLLGAAIMGAVGTGMIPNLESAVRELFTYDAVFEPSSEAQRFYDELYGNYRSAYLGLSGVFESMATMGSK